MAAEAFFSITVFVPTTHGAAVREALATGGGGRSATYDSCSFTSSPGVGRFRPLTGARPHIGTIGLIEEVLEERIETEVAASRLPAVLAAVRAAHPYEVPAIHVVALHGLGGADPLHARPPALLASLEARVAALEAARPAAAAGAGAAASLEARLQRLELAARLATASPAASPARAAAAAAAAGGVSSPSASASTAAAVEGRLAAAEELLQGFAGSLTAHTDALEEHADWLAALERRAGPQPVPPAAGSGGGHSE